MYDLPISLGIIAATGNVDSTKFNDYIIAGRIKPFRRPSRNLRRGFPCAACPKARQARSSTSAGIGCGSSVSRGNRSLRP
ncbi:MAG: hypothetical protein ACLUKN_03265 [Bacilli bacterium]